MAAHRTLFIRAGAVGDFVLTLPLLDALRAAWPDGWVEVMGYPDIASLALRAGLANGVSRVDSPQAGALLGGSPAAGVRVQLPGYDLVVCVWPDPQGVIHRNLRGSGVRRVVMVNPFPSEGSGCHAVDHAANQFKAAGIAVPYRTPRLGVCHEDAAWARERLSAAGLSGVSLLGVHTGSGGARKNWPIQMFRRVAESWLSLPGRGLVLTVGPVEEEARKEALDLPANAQTLVLQGEPLPRVAAMLARCAAFIGNDSGITHLAAAVGAPTLAVFGPTDPALWAPRGKAVRVVGPVRGGGFPGLAEALDALRSLVP